MKTVHTATSVLIDEFVAQMAQPQTHSFKLLGELLGDVSHLDLGAPEEMQIPELVLRHMPESMTEDNPAVHHPRWKGDKV